MCLATMLCGKCYPPFDGRAADSVKRQGHRASNGGATGLNPDAVLVSPPDEESSISDGTHTYSLCIKLAHKAMWHHQRCQGQELGLSPFCDVLPVTLGTL